MLKKWFLFQNCRGNTQGANCERCVEGYEGNPAAKVPCRTTGCYCDPSGSNSLRCDAGNRCDCKVHINTSNKIL